MFRFPTFAFALLPFLASGLLAAPLPVLSEPSPIHKNRFIGFVVDPAGAGQVTALRVHLTMLNHPRRCCTDATGTSCSTRGCDINGHCNTAPDLTCAHQAEPGVPDFSAMQGKVRYVNSFPGGSLACADQGPFYQSYRCATLGCEPEYRDWAADLAFAVNPAHPSGMVYVTGDEVVPSSIFEVSQIAEACGTPPGANDCPDASAALVVETAKWGDISAPGLGPPDGKSDILDCPPSVNKLKGLSPHFDAPRTWLKERDPNPQAGMITVLDLSDAVDAGPQARTYPASRSMDVCDHD